MMDLAISSELNLEKFSIQWLRETVSGFGAAPGCQLFTIASKMEEKMHVENIDKKENVYYLSKRL